MSRILAYLRTSTDKQDLNIQKVESLEYARRISAKHLGYGTPSSLNYYVRTRNFKTEADVG